MNETSAMASAAGHRLESENSIWSRSFQSLLWTNWLTAINDNIFRWFVIGIGKDFPEISASFILAAGTASFVLPYLVFAIPAGWLADRFSKRHVIVGCKILEILLMLLGVFAVSIGNIWFLLAVVFLLGTQSALFAPSKVGKIPELLDETKISAGNGLFNLATLTATIIGMAVGGWLADATGDKGQEKLWLTASVLVGIAGIGTVISFFIKTYPAANPLLKFPVNIFGATCRDIASLYRNGPLFRIALGVVFYWSFAVLGQINIDTFADESGSVFESERTPMLISLVLGVGLGSVLAGIASCGRIELGLVPWATLGMVFFSCALAFAPQHFLIDSGFSWNQIIACTLLACLGISAGFFDVPIASYLQDRSPVATRGSVLAATNFMLFGGVLVTSVLFFPLRSPTWAGSMDGLPPAYSVTHLPRNERDAIDGLEKRLVADWKSSQPNRRPQLTDYLNGLPESARNGALSQLLFADMQQRTATSEELSVEQYATLIPEERRLIASVKRTTSLQPLFSARMIFLLMGILTIPVLAYAVYRLPQAMFRIAVWWLLRLVYRFKVRGMERIPEEGPAMLIANHSSWLDGMLIPLLTRRRVRAIAWAGNFNSKFSLKFAKFAGLILITGGPKSVIKGLREANDALKNGELVCVFPEGGLSRTVQIQGFKPGIMKIIGDLSVPVIPIYLDQIWGTTFSYFGGKPFKKWPTSFRHPISVHVGEPIKPPYDLYQLREQLQNLSADSVNHRAGRFVSPAEKFVWMCKRRKFKRKLNDSTGQAMTGGQLLMRSLILRRLLRKNVLQKDEQNVAVLIPPSSGGIVVNMSLALDRRVAVNLNYTVSNEIMNHCVRQAKIKHVLSTAKVLEKFDFKIDAEYTLLDDLRTKVKLSDKLISAVQAYLVPGGLLCWGLGLTKAKPHDLLTIIFTSGSTGTPKGVMLTQQNIATNVEAIGQVICLNSKDLIAGVLPLFHSFGYTISMWGSMALDIGGAYHFSPLDARQVGKLVQENAATILLATPTFLRSFMKRCTVEEFKSLDVVVVGAEKMPIELSDEFEKKFGFRPTEGYGTTELSPLVSVNVPASRRLDNFTVDCKESTGGRPIATVATRVVDLETGATLGENTSGMLLIKGPNVMTGYLDRQDLTDKVLIDGWYNTGDVALVDSDGFIKITGRMSRFSKIGGEMVPHVTIEEILLKLLGDNDEMPNLAVTAVPDSRKGERLIVLYTTLSKTAEELCAGLSAAGLPNLYIPSRDSFIKIDALPVLGTGKIDLKGLKQMAMDRAGEK